MGRNVWLLPGLLLALGGALAADTHRGHDEPFAHPHDPVLQAEHTDMLNLVRPADATHTAMAAGLPPRLGGTARFPVPMPMF